MNAEELALAYELRVAGCGWKRIAQGLGGDPEYIKVSVNRAVRVGIRSRLTGFGIDQAPRRYPRHLLEAAQLHKRYGMTWPAIALELTGVGDRAAAKSLCAAVTNALNAGHLKPIAP